MKLPYLIKQKLSQNWLYRIRYIFSWIFETKTGNDKFPVSLKSIFLKNFKVDNTFFFMRPFQCDFNFGFFSPFDLNNYIFEIMPFYKKNEIIFKKKRDDFILPISINLENEQLKITKNNQKFILKNLPSNRIQHFKLIKGNKYTFSTRDATIGKPIKIQTQKKPKINIVLFVDGLSHFSQFLTDKEINQLIPNTLNFFHDSIFFENCFSNSEWTLPSTASMLTGKYQHNHGFFHPKFNHCLHNNDTLNNIFSKNGFTTFYIGGGWRNSPPYGHINSIDRALFKRYMKSDDVINYSIDHLSGLKSNNHFMQLCFLDVHHLLGVIPDFSSQINLDIEGHNVTPWYDNENEKKSIFIEKQDYLIQIYKNQLQKLDSKLEVFYNYLNKNFDTDQLVISLISDHGQSYLTSEKNDLNDARLKVPWILKYPGSSYTKINELTQNLDLFNTLVHLNNFKSNNTDSILPSFLSQKEGRSFTISQSIFPNRTYKFALRFKNNEIYNFETSKQINNNGFICIKEDYKISVKNKNKNLDFAKRLFINSIRNWNKNIK